MTKYKVEPGDDGFKILVYTNVNHTSGVLWWKKSTNSMEWRYIDIHGNPINVTNDKDSDIVGDSETRQILIEDCIIKYPSFVDATNKIKELRSKELKNRKLI